MKNKIGPKDTRIGWIGTGVMGASMCGNLLSAGYKATIFSRTRAKAEPLIARGATWADSPREVAHQADIIFSIVGYPHDVREVLLGDQGVVAGSQPGSVLVDMTTSEPALAVEIAAICTKKRLVSIDAPVSGGDVGAKGGTLSIMIGGDQATADALEPCWRAMGSTWVWQGGPGAGQHTKMVNQTLVAAGMVGVCEALVYGHRAGLDLERVLQSVASGAAGSWSLTNLGPRIIAGNFDPGFFVEHFVKDMGITLAESQRMGLQLPGLELAARLYQEMVALGHGRKGTHALILALAKLSGVAWEDRQ
ncbi:MAG: NAD(P)-dependent oxidoreductase [Pirellulales bacterium]|nr:NAD(P)-dependent oxidoreductase [Pirellulales bacterium]